MGREAKSMDFKCAFLSTVLVTLKSLLKTMITSVLSFFPSERKQLILSLLDQVMVG